MTVSEQADNTIFEVIEEFKPLLFKEGKGGLWFVRLPSGWLAVNLNKKRERIKLNQEQISALKSKFPNLIVDLLSNSETSRRIQALRSRMQKAFESTQQAASNSYIENSGSNSKIQFVESLDPNGRGIPGIGELKAATPDSIPRAYTFIIEQFNYTDKSNDTDKSKSKKLVRKIFFSEFALDGFRLDEAVIEYEVSDKEIKALEGSPKTPFLELKFLDAKNLKVTLFDLNRPVGTRTVEKHYRKTLATLQALVEDVFLKKQLLVPKGNLIEIVAKEVYLPAQAVRFADSRASVVRMSETFGTGTPRINEVRAKFDFNIESGWKLIDDQTERLKTVFTKLDSQDIKAFRKAAEEAIEKLRLVINKV